MTICSGEEHQIPCDEDPHRHFRNLLDVVELLGNGCKSGADSSPEKTNNFKLFLKILKKSKFPQIPTTFIAANKAEICWASGPFYVPNQNSQFGEISAEIADNLVVVGPDVLIVLLQSADTSCEQGANIGAE